jgi:hypothetical protein
MAELIRVVWFYAILGVVVIIGALGARLEPSTRAMVPGLDTYRSAVLHCISNPRYGMYRPTYKFVSHFLDQDFKCNLLVGL